MTSSSWSPSARLFKWLTALALVPFAAVVAVHWADAPGANDGDYAQYLLHAKAIAELRPYSDIGYIYSRMNLVGPAAQPPGWPLVLAPFVAAFGTDSPVIKLLVVLLVAAVGVVAGLYFARQGEKVAAIAVAAVVPLALEIEWATGSALSDPLFCLLVWITLYVADSDKPIDWKRGTLVAVLCVATISVRIAGVALPPAILLYLLLFRRQDARKAIVPLALVIGLGAVVAIFARDQIPFVDRIVRAFDRSRALARFAATYKGALANSVLFPFSSNGANDLYHALAAVPLLIGLVLFIKQRARSVLACFILMYGALLVVAPVAELRYAWPLTPLGIVWFVSGLTWLGNRLVPRWRPAIPRVALALAGAVTFATAVQLIQRPARPALLGNPDTRELFDWMRQTADTSDIRVVFSNPRVLTLETRVPAMGIPSGDVSAVLAEFDRKHITHVVVARRPVSLRERNFSAFISGRPQHFVPAFLNETHDVRRFVSAQEPASGGGPFLDRRPQ